MRPRRLKTREQFQAVLACAPTARTEHFSMHSLDLGAAPAAAFSAPGPWLGALVPKRWARRAVTRNLIRRQIHALASARPLLLSAHGAHVVRLRSAFDPMRYRSAASPALRAAVRAELLQLFERALRQRGHAP